MTSIGSLPLLRRAAAILAAALLAAPVVAAPPTIGPTPVPTLPALPPEPAPVLVSPSALPTLARLNGASVRVESAGTLLVVQADRPLRPTVYTRTDGQRVVLDFADAETRAGFDSPRLPREALVTAVRMNAITQDGHPHVQFEIESDVSLAPSLVPGESPNTVVVLFPGRRAAPAAPPVASPPAPPASKRPAAAERAAPAVAEAAPDRPPAPTAPRKPAAGPRQGHAAPFPCAEWKGPEVFVVHFTSFRDRASAEKDAARVTRALGRTARALPVDLGAKGTWYRVVAGEFPTFEEAAAWRSELEAKGTTDLGAVYRLTAK